MRMSGASVLNSIALLSSLLLLTACGQKGPLYLPQDTNVMAEDVASDSAPAEVATEKDKPKASVPTTDNQD